MKNKLLGWCGFIYNPKNGFFYRGNKRITTKTGSGYIRLTFGTKYKPAHRIGYELVHGIVPDDKEVDHINGDILDNRIKNLRVVSIRENQQNRKIHREENRLVGAHVDNKWWRAQVTYKSKKKYLGRYDTEIEAHTAYLNFLDKHGITYLKEIDKRKS